MCLGTTTTSPTATNTINWGRGPWDERPPIQVGDPASAETSAKPAGQSKKSSLKAPKSQSSKTSGGAY